MQNLNALIGVAYRESCRFSVPQLGYLGYQITDGEECSGVTAKGTSYYPRMRFTENEKGDSAEPLPLICQIL